MTTESESCFHRSLSYRTNCLTRRPHNMHANAPKTAKYGNKCLRTLSTHLELITKTH